MRKGRELIDPERLRAIDAALDGIAAEVRILLAIESGSRAWGFPSPDSDYDVRLVYARPLPWYISVEQRRDVIEQPMRDDLDIGGWDIRKALALLCKGNPVLIEWLASPTVYRGDAGAMERLRGFAAQVDHRRAARHHYFYAMRRAYGDCIAGRDQVRLKKYFYALRPAAALAWMQQNRDGLLPMELPALLAGIDLSPSLRSLIDDLRLRKAETREMGEGGRIPELDAFIEGWLAKGPPPAADAAIATPELVAEADRLLFDLLSSADRNPS